MQDTMITTTRVYRTETSVQTTYADLDRYAELDSLVELRERCTATERNYASLKLACTLNANKLLAVYES